MNLKPIAIIHEGNKLKLNELWLSYPNNPNYLVSNLGRIRGWHGGHNRWINKKTRKDKDGYLIVGLTNLNGTLTTARVHRMVAETFIPNPSNCPVVNHKDNIKDNNDVSNLEWVTISYNTKHGYHIGASVSKASKIIKASFPNGELYSYYGSCSKMAKAFKIGRSRAEKDVKSGSFLNILNLEIVEEIPKDTIVGKIAFDHKIDYQFLNPYKITYKNNDIKYYDTIKTYAQEFDLTHSQAQRVLVNQLPHLLRKYNIHKIEKLSHEEYSRIYFNY